VMPMTPVEGDDKAGWGRRARFGWRCFAQLKGGPSGPVRATADHTVS
jgi:hypothetical protein